MPARKDYHISTHRAQGRASSPAHEPRRRAARGQHLHHSRTAAELAWCLRHVPISAATVAMAACAWANLWA